jgi:hypothetical protein
MLEVLQFIFRDFVTWLGSVLLIGAVTGGIAGIVRAFRWNGVEKKDGEN